MTCIVGLKDSKTGKIVLGSDRGLFIDEEVIITDHPKVFSKTFDNDTKKFVIGICGDASFCDKIEIIDFDDLTLDGYEGLPAKYFLKEKFIPYLEDAISNVRKVMSGSDFLIAIEDDLFYVDSTLSVTQCPDWGMATGSAGKWARGALYALKDLDLHPIDKAEIALKAAEQCSIYCRGPFDFIELK